MRPSPAPARVPAPRPLRDILVPRLRVVFVGIDPSIASGVVGHHFAGEVRLREAILERTPEPAP